MFWGLPARLNTSGPEAAGARGDHRKALGGVAGCPNRGRIPAGLRDERWFGIGAPKNTPSEIIDRLNKEINAGLADPKMKARISEFGATAFPGSPADFGKLIAEDTQKWGKVVRAANIKPE